MITTNNILDAISAAIAAKYGPNMAYVNEVPKDFKRPSFAIDFDKSTAQDAMRHVVQVMAHYVITCFAVTDVRGLCDQLALNTMQYDVMKLFNKGTLAVADRHLTVRAFTGGSDPDRAWVDLQFLYFDDRSDDVDTTPMIGDVDFVFGASAPE